MVLQRKRVFLGLTVALVLAVGLLPELAAAASTLTEETMNASSSRGVPSSVHMAVRPKREARYTGVTSQGKRLVVKVNRQRNIQSLDTEIATSCSVLGPLQLDEFDFGIGVHRRDGSFSDTYTDTEVGGDTFHGEGLLQVAKHEISGKFVTRRKVVGLWRVRSVFYYDALFPDDSEPVAKCDTGVVSWSAILGRARS